MLPQWKRAIVPVLTTLLVAVACTGPALTPAVVRVTIDDGERVVEAGSTLTLTVTVETRGGASEAVLWTSDEPDTATVSSTGVVMGMAAGEARITATSALDASRSDTVTITVTPPPVAPEVLSVSIDAGDRSVLVGETLHLSATVATVGGASDAVTWTSGDTGTATVSTAGLVSGITVGQALITATSVFDASKSDSTFVSVVAVPPGAPARISVVTGDGQTTTAGSAVPIPPTVRVRDADENPLQGVSVTFTVTDGDGTIAPTTPVTTNADGIATLSSWTLGTTAGMNGVRATVTGSNPPISVTFTATGVPGPASPQTSTVTANPTSLLADGTATSQLTIQLKDAYGNDLTTGGATVTFATPIQGSIGAVTDNGNGTYSATYTAGTTAATVTITPRVNTMSFANTTTIILTTAVLAVTIDQANPSIIEGDTLQLTATVEAVGGASASVTWDSHHPTIATINPATGLLTGHSPGTATITATSTHDPTKNDSVTATIAPRPTGDLIWSRTIGSAGSDEEIAGVAIDGHDNVIVAFNTNGHSWGSGGMVLAKIDRDGTTLWYRGFGTAADERVQGVAVDSLGDIIVTGLTHGDFGGTNAGDADVFVAKFDAGGNHQWSVQFGTAVWDAGTVVATTSDGEILVGGVSNRYQLFLSKYTPDGNRIWSHESDWTLETIPWSIDVNRSGATILAGQYYKTGFVSRFDAAGNMEWSLNRRGAVGVAFDSYGDVLIAGSSTENPFLIPYTAFLGKLDGSGNGIWSHTIGPAEGSSAPSVATDHEDHALVAGTTRGYMGGPDPMAPAFLAKYDTHGNRIWVRQFHPDARFVAVDSTGNSIVGGTFDGEVHLMKFAP